MGSSDLASNMDWSDIDKDIMTSLFSILEEFDHPFTIVGQLAHRWMGCGGCCDEAIDLLLRDDQLTSISQRLVESGKWEYFDPHINRHGNALLSRFDRMDFLDYYSDADLVLEIDATIASQWSFNYIRIWSEQTYHLKVDEVSWSKVPALFYGEPLVAEESFHPAADRTDSWFFGLNLLSHSNGKLFTAGQLDGNHLVVPNIPSYLDALIYQITQYNTSKPGFSFIARWLVCKLTRYLYLELPGRRSQVLLQVEAETEPFLDQYLDNYKRKPRYTLNKDQKLTQIQEWLPKPQQ